MSIASEINRINNNIAATYTALSAKGATMPATENSANLASTVATVPSGGGVDPSRLLFDVNNGVASKPVFTFNANSFAGITSISNYGLERAFNDRTGLTGSISFPNLTTIGSSGLSVAFSGCTGLTGSVSFPNLTTIGENGLNNTFSGCTHLTTISFPNLTTVSYQGLIRAFNNCYNLTGSVSFPKLTTVGTNALYNALSNCSGITEIHFPAAIQSIIEATNGYSSKFGASNATIYFDL